MMGQGTADGKRSGGLVPKMCSAVPAPNPLCAASMTHVARVAMLLVCALTIDRIGRKCRRMAVFAAGAILLAVLGSAAPGMFRL